MDENIVKLHIPKKYNAEDKIFNLCDVESPEFVQFITNFDDVVGPFSRRYLSDDFKDLKLDHVSLRANGDLIHGEHHAMLSRYVMRRNFQFLTSLHLASKRFIHPFIFNTGPIPKNTIEFASPTSFYNPLIVNTQEIEESIRLNNVKYKIDHNDEINIFDVFDLIWMPKYRSDRNPEDIVVELSGIYNKLVINEDYLNLLRTSLILWAGKFVSNEEKINKIVRELKMSAQEVKITKQDIIDARIDGMICRAEEAGRKEGKVIGRKEGKVIGRKEGIALGRERIVLELLEFMSPEEVSQKTSLSLEEILKIKNGN